MYKKIKNLKEILLIIAFILIGLWIISNTETLVNLFKNLFAILFPFILGAFIAFILNIPLSFFERKLKKLKNKKIIRVLSIIFALFIVLLAILLIITLIVPELIEVIKIFINNIPFYIEKLNNIMDKLNIESRVLNNINVDSLKEQIIQLIPSLLTSVSSIVSGISNFVIAFIFAIYLLVDKEKLQRQIKKLMKAYLKPKVTNIIMNVAHVSNKIFKNFFTVQSLEAVILGTLCIIGMLILGIPYAVPIGILVGITALIPVVGAFIGLIIGLILIVVINPIKAIYFVIFLLILQQIEGNLIYPKVVGSSMGLPGMWVFFAVTIGGSLGGVIGILLGVPVATIIYVLLQKDVNKKISQKEKL